MGDSSADFCNRSWLTRPLGRISDRHKPDFASTAPAVEQLTSWLTDRGGLAVCGRAGAGWRTAPTASVTVRFWRASEFRRWITNRFWSTSVKEYSTTRLSRSQHLDLATQRQQRLWITHLVPRFQI